MGPVTWLKPAVFSHSPYKYTGHTVVFTQVNSEVVFPVVL
jgi:hypothetical protein